MDLSTRAKSFEVECTVCQVDLRKRKIRKMIIKILIEYYIVLTYLFAILTKITRMAMSSPMESAHLLVEVSVDLVNSIQLNRNINALPVNSMILNQY